VPLKAPILCSDGPRSKREIPSACETMSIVNLR
jgi:hypothetical protein